MQILQYLFPSCCVGNQANNQNSPEILSNSLDQIEDLQSENNDGVAQLPYNTSSKSLSSYTPPFFPFNNSLISRLNNCEGKSQLNISNFKLDESQNILPEENFLNCNTKPEFKNLLTQQHQVENNYPWLITKYTPNNITPSEPSGTIWGALNKNKTNTQKAI